MYDIYKKETSWPIFLFFLARSSGRTSFKNIKSKQPKVIVLLKLICVCVCVCVKDCTHTQCPGIKKGYKS